MRPEPGPPPTLWHYTCDHGHAAIRGWIKPNPLAPLPFAWFTDLNAPVRDALGLTSVHLACDRTRHRYQVTDTADVAPWHTVRLLVPARIRDDLETAPGALPMHWWVSAAPVPVAYAPRDGASFAARRGPGALTFTSPTYHGRTKR